MSRRKVIPLPESTDQEPPKLPEKLLTAEEVMQLLGVSRGEIHNMMKRGLKCYRLGKQRGLRFAEEDLACWLQAQKIS